MRFENREFVKWVVLVMTREVSETSWFRNQSNRYDQTKTASVLIMF